MMKNLALSLADGAASPVTSMTHEPCCSIQCPSAQAPATRLKRFAKSAIEEAKGQGAFGMGAIKRAGNMTKKNLKNAERDLHRLFRNLGLTLPLRLSTFRFGLLQVHYLSLVNWFAYLITTSSEMLLGGFNAASYNAGVLLRSFWDAYFVDHQDHWVFQQDHLDFAKTVPFFVHLDEGTGLRKTGVMVYNFQVVWGQDTCLRFDEIFKTNPGRTDADVLSYMQMAQTHNQRGSSYTTRYLYTILPKRWYTKKFAGVYDLVLKNLTQECCRLASEGVAGWHFICLGVKGDAPALAKAGHLTRTFQTLVI